MLERFGRATLHSAPTRHELILGHLAYLLGLALLAWIVAGLAGRATPIGIGTALEAAGVGVALGFLCLFWAVRVRQTAPELWFLSHLVWLSLTYALVFVAVAVSTLGVILASSLPQSFRRWPPSLYTPRPWPAGSSRSGSRGAYFVVTPPIGAAPRWAIW